MFKQCSKWRNVVIEDDFKHTYEFKIKRTLAIITLCSKLLKMQQSSSELVQGSLNSCSNMLCVSLQMVPPRPQSPHWYTGLALLWQLLGQKLL